MPLQGALEDNVLSLLIHNEEHAPVLALRLEAALFSTRVYKDIAEAALDYLLKYGKPPGLHILDIFETRLMRGNDEGKFLRQTLDAAAKLAPELDAAYVVDQLDSFIEERQLSNTLENAMERLAQGDVAGAREAMLSGMPLPVEASPGIYLHRPDEALAFLNEREEPDAFSTGIAVLDEMKIRPARKKLMMFIAASNFGKSWFLVNCGKQAIMSGKKTLHMTGEMSDEDVAERYVQALYSMTTNEISQVRVPMFTRNAQGLFEDIDFDVLEPKQLTRDTRRSVAAKLKGLARRGHLKIKEFPAGDLTIAQLEQYLDYLAKVENFVPDQLLLDSPDNMSLDSANLRVDTGRNILKIRGLAQRRNVAVVAVSQGNRESSSVRVIRGKHVAEDWSKIGTSDIVLTGNQTEEEEKINLARIWVEKSRKTKKHFSVLISQSYEVGQFCLDSVYMNTGVTQDIKRLTGED